MKADLHSPGRRAFTRQRGFQLLAVVVCALVPSVASAANISIFDTDTNFSIAGTDFEFGFTATLIPSQETITFNGSWISNGGTTGTGIVYLVEPQSPTLISDILQVSFSCDSPFGCLASISGTFNSDITGNLGTLPAGFPGLVETGTLQNVTGLFRNPVTGALVTIPANLTIQIQSDTDETGEVPEPTALLLLGTGGAGLIAKLRRRKLQSS